MREVLRSFDTYLKESQTWAHQHAKPLQEKPVAYFSAEFGFHETLPIAAGGLGMLAGDHAKSASDLGIGFVGISLFYREGYFQQAIDPNNWQTEYYTLLNPKNLPMEPVLDAKGDPLVCQVEIGMNQVAFQAWRVNVGRATVYFWTPTGPRTSSTSVISRCAFMAAIARHASCRKFSWALAEFASCARWVCSPRSFT